jgi:hypothetical protein
MLHTRYWWYSFTGRQSATVQKLWARDAFLAKLMRPVCVQQPTPWTLLLYQVRHHFVVPMISDSFGNTFPMFYRIHLMDRTDSVL